jgi:hypothetical protein
VAFFPEGRVSYLKLNQMIVDPYKEPTWVQDVENATPFDTRERAEAAKVRVAKASGVIHDAQEDYWYVVRA